MAVATPHVILEGQINFLTIREAKQKPAGTHDAAIKRDIHSPELLPPE